MVLGLYTAALKTYVTGLGEGKEPLLSRDRVQELLTLLEKHPFLRRIETVTVQDPLAAEKHYFNGRSQFRDRRYADAERNFRAAIEQFNQDARYFYYLGLARLAQGQRDAYEYFRQGARLESQNHPAPDAVNKDLETVQGAWRRLINEARTDPR
jgi:tetratricopeptide (TPR) repeat protein